MRHAKAEQVGATDRERALAPRGRTDAAGAARWLVERQIVPDHVLVSSAVRTRQTWETVRETAGWQVEATYDAGLYAAMPETVIDLIRLAPGGPFDLERPLPQAAMENLARVYGLDQPLYVQFGRYLAALVQGDLGPSFSFRDLTVAELFARGLPVSMLEQVRMRRSERRRSWSDR